MQAQLGKTARPAAIAESGSRLVRVRSPVQGLTRAQSPVHCRNSSMRGSHCSRVIGLNDSVRAPVGIEGCPLLGAKCQGPLLPVCIAGVQPVDELSSRPWPNWLEPIEQFDCRRHDGRENGNSPPVSAHKAQVNCGSHKVGEALSGQFRWRSRLGDAHGFLNFASFLVVRCLRCNSASMSGFIADAGFCKPVRNES